MTNIFIFNNASRAANYGIGTYVRQLSAGLCGISDIRVSLVEMYADTKEFAILDDKDGVRHYLIPPLDSGIENETYCRVIFYYLARNIGFESNDKTVFQFNYFQHYTLALLLKSYFVDSSIILTVHYMNWCFELNGNVNSMRKIIAEEYKPIDEKENRILSSFINEKKFLHLAEVVFVLSRKTKKILSNDYCVSTDKMYLVYNGIANDVCCNFFSHDNKCVQRNILYVGRLDEIKGLKFLIKAFERVVKKYPDTQLVIVGDGDFQPYLEQSRRIQGHVSFLGKMSSDDLERVYTSASIGVMPSFHEQCSYTVIEMMRHGIPVVGTDTTGLAEMLDATPDLLVNINEENFQEATFVLNLVSKIEMLLSDDKIYRLASDAVYKQYKERYTLTVMTRNVYEVLQTLHLNTMYIVSSDYLPEIDERMITLINRHPDIEMEFYGMTGIGVYLWWRVLQLEKDVVTNGSQLALIKEHLIYYLDWVEELISSESFVAELYQMLVSMYKHSFCTTKVKNIMAYTENISHDAKIPSEQEILQNALRICVCKI